MDTESIVLSDVIVQLLLLLGFELEDVDHEHLDEYTSQSVLFYKHEKHNIKITVVRETEF